MKKMMIYLGWAVAAMAALGLVSCQKQFGQEEESALHPVSFEAGIGTAGTKMSLTDGTAALKARWEVGDEVVVIWGSADTEYEKFTVTSVKDDGRTAVFSNASSALPTTGTVAVGVYYPYLSRNISYKCWLPNYLFNQGDWFPYSPSLDTVKPDLANAGKCTQYGAWDIAVTDGVFPAISMRQLNAFLKIPSGTSTSCDEALPRVFISSMYYLIMGKNDSCEVNTSYTGDVGFDTMFFAKDYHDASTQKTTCDIYLPVVPGMYAGLTLTLGKPGSGNGRSISLGDKDIEAGKVYDLSGKL